MIAHFWSGLGGEFAKQWVGRVITPAFAFWAGGLAAIWWDAHSDGVRSHGWAPEFTETAQPFQSLSGFAQGLLVVAGLLLLAVSALVAERLTLPLLRLLEGFWSRPRWLRRMLMGYRRQRRRQLSERVQHLRRRQRRGTLNPAEWRELMRLAADPAPDTDRLANLQRRAQEFDAEDAAKLAHWQRKLRRSPRRDVLGMPTRLGDILRACEQRPLEKYGLDAVICWNSLWLLLPTDIKTEIAQSRLSIDNATRAWLWGGLFLVWTPWTWFAVPVGLLVPLLAYYLGILSSASVFGDLVVAAFDLHRMRLYDSLHLPRPQSPAEERSTSGPRITNLLWGGLDEPGLRYTFSEAPDGTAGSD